MTHSVVTFSSKLGWMAMVCHDGLIAALTFGYDSVPAAVRGLPFDDVEVRRARAAEKQWVERLRAFTAGAEDSLQDFPLDWSGYTPFQRAVVQRCREIPYGSTMTYGELADRAGAPRAARAVGNVMRCNRYPLVIPCHRVVASGGALGGFSSRNGVSMKRRLLDLESRASPKRDSVPST